MAVAQTAVQALRLFGSLGGDGGLVMFSHDVLFSAVVPRTAYAMTWSKNLEKTGGTVSV